MRLIILAVTKSYDGFCIAGMNDEGKWIRPISLKSPGRFWTRTELTLKNGEFTVPGDIWEIEGNKPERFQYRNHTEDFNLTSRKYVGRLNNSQLLRFLEQHCEGAAELNAVYQADGRSLCLVEPDNVTFFTTTYDERVKPKMFFRSRTLSLSNPRTNDGSIIVKDCKWEAIVKQQNLILDVFSQKYLCIGLATPTAFDGIEYPQVIGLHTDPEHPKLPSYPD